MAMVRRPASEIRGPLGSEADAGIASGGLPAAASPPASGPSAAATGAGARGRPAVLVVLSAVLVVYLAVPFVVGFASLDAATAATVVGDAVRAGAVGVSLGTATVSTAVSVIFGVPLAYVLARGQFPGRSLVGAAVYLPIVVPPLAGGLLLLTVFGPHGPVGAWLEARNIRLTDAWAGIVLAQVFVASPFLIVASLVAFRMVDPALERVSYSLGVPPLQTFFRVSLPLAWPGIVAGLPLAWLRALGEFGATAMLAYHPYSLPVYLFVQFGAEGVRAALPLAALLAALGTAALVAVRAAGGIGGLPHP
jgi:ABC-type sulfate transport system permease component